MFNKGYEIVGTIDVGSNNIKMLIAEIKKDDSIKILDELKYDTFIGRDTFSTGRISLETLREASGILKNYSKVMKEYGVKKYRAVSTSGIREAENREYVLEQIKLKSGIEVEIINSAEERFITYKAIRYKVKGVRKARQEGLLIVNIGSGGIEVSLYQDGSLGLSEYIKIGSLRLREILSDLESMTVDFPKVMEEYIKSKIYLIEEVIRNRQVGNVIGLGGGMATILSLAGNLSEPASEDRIDRELLEGIYTAVRSMSTDQIADRYGLDLQDAKLILPSVIIFKRFMDLTRAKTMFAPMVSLRHGMVAQMVDKYSDTERKQDFENDIISSARYIAGKYGIDQPHARRVENISMNIFDSTSTVHKMKNKDRMLLRVASILHDAGKYVNFDNHNLHSYHIIKASNIISFSNRELNIIANIAYFHSGDFPGSWSDIYRGLYYKDKIRVSKLAAILRLADALDNSHEQKIDKIEIHRKKDQVIFEVYTDEDIILEEWTFGQNADFFEEVTGLRPVIHKRGSDQ